MDDRTKARRALIGAVIVFCINAGLQVSGYQNIWTAVALWSMAGILGLYWLKLITAHSRRGKMIVGFALMILGCSIGIFGLSLIASGTSSTAILAKIVPPRSDPFKLGDGIYLESRSVKTTDGRDTRLYETAFYLVVSNESGDGSTMRNIQAELVGYEPPVAAAVRGSSLDRIDLKHGQAVFFLIGRTVGTDYLGNFVGDITYVPDRLRRYVQNIASSRKPTFEVWSSDNVYRFGLNDDKSHPEWKLTVVISAEDKKSKQVDLDVKPSSQIPIGYMKEN